MSGIQMALLGAFGFPPVTNTYTSGTAATETVPSGASSCTITVDGAGGSGAFDATTFQPGGGGGSARSVKAIAVTGGNTFTYTVAPQVAGVGGFDSNGTNGAASTVTGSPSGGSVNMSGGGGQGGQIGTGGTGGTASGGDTNTSGSAGTVSFGGTAASGAGNSVAPGGGGNGAFSGTSGVGARGQISFAYT
jgi:hypothetical protein